MSLRTNGRVYHAVVRSILLYGCETWPVLVACWRSLNMTASTAFYVKGAEIVCHLWNGVATPALQVYRQCSCKAGPCWFGHAERLPEGVLIKNLLLPILPRTWRSRTRGQLKAWNQADVEPIPGPRVFSHARRRKHWVKVSSELAQDRRTCSASVSG